MGLSELVPCVVALLVGKYQLGFGIDTLRTLAFVVIVFGNQATTYTNRARRRLWAIRPSWWLIASSVVDLSIATTMASRGLAMAPLPLPVIGAALAGAVCFTFLADFAKVPVFSRLEIV
jgi:H+-transporting ATPase